MAASSVSNISPNSSVESVDVTGRTLEVFAQRALLIAHIALPIIEVVAFTLVITLGFTFPPSMVISLIFTGVAAGVCQAILPNAPFGGSAEPQDSPQGPSQQSKRSNPLNQQPSDPSEESQDLSQLPKLNPSSQKPSDEPENEGYEIVEEENSQQVQNDEEESRLEKERRLAKDKETSENTGTRFGSITSTIENVISVAGSVISQGFSQARERLPNVFNELIRRLQPARSSQVEVLEMDEIEPPEQLDHEKTSDSTHWDEPLIKGFEAWRNSQQPSFSSSEDASNQVEMKEFRNSPSSPSDDEVEGDDESDESTPLLQKETPLLSSQIQQHTPVGSTFDLVRGMGLAAKARIVSFFNPKPLSPYDAIRDDDL